MNLAFHNKVHGHFKGEILRIFSFKKNYNHWINSQGVQNKNCKKECVIIIIPIIRFLYDKSCNWLCNWLPLFQPTIWRFIFISYNRIMSRSVAWRRTCNDVVFWRQCQALNATIYILRETGPTGFLLKEEGETKPVKVPHWSLLIL